MTCAWMTDDGMNRSSVMNGVMVMPMVIRLFGLQTSNFKPFKLKLMDHTSKIQTNDILRCPVLGRDTSCCSSRCACCCACGCGVSCGGSKAASSAVFVVVLALAPSPAPFMKSVPAGNIVGVPLG